jgi:HEAT repeat protein
MNANATPTASTPLAEFLTRIQSSDESVSGPAWQGAQSYGAAAIPPLAALLDHSDFEVARNAKRALCQITRHAGRPGAKTEAKAAETALLAALGHPKAVVRRQALWMLSEMGSGRAVKPMAALLRDPEVREDARAALLRLPGPRVTPALRAAFRAAPEDFKCALADSLRKRGVQVLGYPSRRLVPTGQTTVKALA